MSKRKGSSPCPDCGVVVVGRKAAGDYECKNPVCDVIDFKKDRYGNYYEIHRTAVSRSALAAGVGDYGALDGVESVQKGEEYV